MSAVVQRDNAVGRAGGTGAGGGVLGAPFLRARFTPPPRPATYVRRQRLVGHLDRARETPLTVVAGPAGAGKTLLVSDWATGLRLPVAWLTAEADDRLPGLFWAHVVQALRGCGARIPDVVRVPADAARVDSRLLADLAAVLSSRVSPVVLVIDAYEQVSTREIGEQLEFVLRHSGPGMRLVLVGRTEPVLPLHRYRVAGDVTEVRGAELAFSTAETGALLRLHGLALPTDSVRALVDRTRGWAVGLRSCALAASESGDPAACLAAFRADRGTVADYLLREVFQRQPAAARDLLLRVSVVERFSSELANALTGRMDAESLLVALRRGNAFVECPETGWYRLHPLFREVLRAHLRVRLPSVEPELHRRAARWFREQGAARLREPLVHAAAAGDWEFAADSLVEDLALGRLFLGHPTGGGPDLARLFSGMGSGATGASSELVRAALALSRCDLRRGLPQLRHAERLLTCRLSDTGRSAEEGRTHRSGGGETAAPGTASAWLSCALLEALAARLAGAPVWAEKAAETADTLLREVPERLLEEHPELSALLLTHLGSARLWAGRYDEARAALEKASRPVRHAPGEAASLLLPRADALAQLALIDYLHGWPVRAERRVLAGAPPSGTQRGGQPAGAGQPGRRPYDAGVGLGPAVLAAAAVEHGDLGRAQSLIEGVGGPGCAAHDPVQIAGQAIAGAQLRWARGDIRAAEAAGRSTVSALVASPWAAAHEALLLAAEHVVGGRPRRAVAALEGVSPDHPWCAVEAARLLLAAGRPTDAVDLVDRVRARHRVGPAVTVRAVLVKARVAAEAGDAAAARKLVASALVDARRERLRRPFLDARPWIRPLLATPPLAELAAGWLTSHPRRQGERTRRAAQPGAPVVPELSAREHEVLQRLAEVMSIEEIAADLHVSVNTVKTHLKGVYRKLAVNRRNEAVRRARELQLL